MSRSIDTFSLGSTSWIRVGGRLIKVLDQLDQRSYQRDMDSQMVPPQDGARYDPTVPPPPPPSQSAPQAMSFTLHSQTGVAPPPVTAPTPTSEDLHARMDRLEQRLRMPEIERYMGIGCPRIHLRLYSTIMRAHGLDGAQMIMLFPMSLGGAAQRWFASLDVSRHWTWDDLAQEFLRQYAFNTIVDVSRPPNRDQVQMLLRSLQPRIAGHVVGVPFADFGSLILALYDVEDGISRGLWTDSSPSDIKEKSLRRTEVSGCERHWFFQSEASQAPSTGPTAIRASFFLCTSSVQAIGTSHTVEPSSSEAYEGRVVNCSQDTTLTDSTSVQDGSALRIPSGLGHETD
ncbi:hypothetical protein CK203_094719 [Vitis vinifera]|uniref:Retrotransposon gag domain-containing protein n=1 Tax=Vitis vinifera TaxID=29760 RepID=A0A438BWX7_VITVI|nr:hypothetical protein CK203_094719 [Vitis vinifera]